MKRIATLLKKDILLGFKDVFILLELGFAVVLVVLMIFVLPEETNVEATVFIYDDVGIIEPFIDRLPAEIAEVTGELFVDNRQDVIDGMVDNRSAMGVAITARAGGDAKYDVELLTQPNTTQAMIDYIRVEIEDMLSIITPPAGAYPPDVYESVRVTSLQEGLRDEIPFNQLLMPVVLLFMVGVLGLFAMVSLLGQERGDQTIRAFRVSPAGLWEFLTSKHLTILFTGICTFSILYIPMMGLGGYLPALVLVVLTIVIGSALGTLLGAFFTDPMAAIGYVLIVMLLLGLPAVSLLAPVFSSPWLKIIPSYYTLFGLDAVMFPDGSTQVFRQAVVILAGYAAVLYLLSGLVFSRQTRKEA
jgi:hypothetical protein